MKACSVASIAHLIPHAGSMLLLDQILDWDDGQLRARTASHLSADNPLRDAAGLHAACGIEYAAQAMALHGALRAAAPSARGMLASVRDVRIFAPRLDRCGETLEVETRLLSGDTRLAMYVFAIYGFANDGSPSDSFASERVDSQAAAHTILTGRATVLLDLPTVRPALSGRG